MTDELDDFEPFDCQTVGRVISSWEMLRLLRTINALVDERNVRRKLPLLDISHEPNEEEE